MKKTIIFFIIFLVYYFNIYSQNEQIIYVNQKNNVHLFFDSPIISGVCGNEQYLFVYNTEKKEKLGILKGSPGAASNLLVITDDGNVFSFILKYKKEISKFNYFIESNKSIRNIKGNKKNNSSSVSNKNEKKDNISTGNITENDYDNIKKRGVNKNINKYDSNCKNVISKGAFYKRYQTNKSGIKFRFKNLVYKDDHFYFLCEIDNSTNIDYDLNFMEFYISTKKKKLRSSSQKIAYKPEYIYNKFTRVKGKNKHEFIYVLEKFTIDKNKVLIIELNELKGERNLELIIDAEIINNPN